MTLQNIDLDSSDAQVFDYLNTNFTIAQTKEEIVWAWQQIRSCVPDVRVALEIGSSRGGNLCMLSRLLGDDGLLISINIDIVPDWLPLDSKFVEQFVSPIEFVHIEARCESPRAMSRLEEVLQGRKIDVLFADAAHRYEHTRYVFEQYSRYVNSPGVMVFHDIGLPHGVDDFWTELKDSGTIVHMQKVHKPGEQGLGLAFVPADEPLQVEETIRPSDFNEEYAFTYLDEEFVIDQNQEEILWVMSQARGYLNDVNTIVELGSSDCGSLCMLSKLFTDGGLAVGIGKDAQDSVFVNEFIDPALFIPVKYSAETRDAVSLLEKMLRGGKVDVLLVNIKNTRELTEVCFRQYSSFMAVPSIVIFHGISAYGPNILWNRIKGTGQFMVNEKISEPGTHGLGIVYLQESISLPVVDSLPPIRLVPNVPTELPGVAVAVPVATPTVIPQAPALAAPFAAGQTRKIIFSQEQSPGDILTMTNAVGDLKRSYPNWLVDVRSPAPAVWENNPHLTPLDDNDPEVETYVITYDNINISGWYGLHYTDAFRHDIEKKLNLQPLSSSNTDEEIHKAYRLKLPLPKGIVDHACLDSLKEGVITDSLRTQLSHINIDIPDDVTVSVNNPRSEWAIRGPNGSLSILIKHEHNQVNVYDALSEKVRRWGITEIQKTNMKPELWVSDEEKSWFHQIHCEYFWDGPYWVINAGRKPDNELKQYHRWQEVVRLLNDYFRGRVKIVQMGHQDHIHPPLEGTFSVVGKTDIRQLIRLIHWAHGTIGPLSFQFVISAAFEQPAVCVAGGKEGVKWHLYPHMRYLYTNGALPCCVWDGCWLGGEQGACKNLADGAPKCFQLITPQMIADAVIMYYEGGRLPMPTATEVAGWAKKILVLEDDPKRQEGFKQKLGHAHAVLVVDNAPDAIELLKSDKFDVVFLDYHLGAEGSSKALNNGGEVAKFLAEQQLDAHVIVHCHEGWGVKNITKFLPNAELRPGFWS